MYEALVRLGKASAPTISQESGVPYGQIYNTLKSLISKQLVRLIPEKSKMFAPVDPEELNKVIDKRKAELDKLKKDVKRLKQTFARSTEQSVFIAEGERNFWQLVKKLPQSKKYNYNITYNVTIDDKKRREAAYEAQTKKNAKDLKSLDNYNKDSAPIIKEWQKIFPDRKRKALTFKNDGVVAILQDDEIVMLTLINANTHVLIKDPAFAKMMKHFFLTEWKQSKEI